MGGDRGLSFFWALGPIMIKLRNWFCFTSYHSAVDHFHRMSQALFDMINLSIVVSLQKVHMEIAQFEKNRKKLSPAGGFGTSSLRYVLEKSQPQIFPNISPKK